MEVKEISLSELVPYEKNPRRNDEAVDFVAKSIQSFGFKDPIVIDADNVIVCGHTRYKAAKKLKMKSVPCIVALADNKTAELAAWDDALLLDELGDLSMFDFDMAEFGFDTSKIGAWHKSWARTEKYCDLKKKIQSHSNGDMIFNSLYEVGKRGIPIDKIKEDKNNVEIFSDNLCDYLMCYTGGVAYRKGIGVSVLRPVGDIRTAFISQPRFASLPLKICLSLFMRTLSLLKIVTG